MDAEILEDLLGKVANKFGYNDPENWQDGLFLSLSREIEKETRFIISRNTLKRLYGKIKTSENYNPQIDTRNALAQYAGYPDWNKFRSSYLEEKRTISQPQTQGKTTENKPTEKVAQVPKTKGNRLKTLIFFFVVILGIGLWLFWPKPIEEPDFSRVKVHVQNPVDTAPFTLVVDYEIPSDIHDSLFLGVGGKKHLLNPEKKIFVHSLALPVYSFVYLRTKDKILRAIPIKAYSRDLECYYEHEKFVQRVDKKFFLGDGVAGLKRSFFEGKSLDSSQFLTSFYKVKDFNIDCDNFTIKMRYKIDPSGSICHSVETKLYADSGHHEIEVFNKGCAQHNFVAPAELYFGGKFENLTAISAEPGSWHELTLNVRNKKFEVVLNGGTRFQSLYKKTMGRLKVLKFRFKGFGQMDYIRLYDHTGKLIEAEEF